MDLSSIDPATLAHEIWMKNYKIKMIEESAQPRLYLMSGLPLSGKSYMANRLIERSPADVVYIENDLVRGMIMEHLGIERPSYTQEEHTLVFNTSHELVWLALSFSFHTIFDATNLNERYRKKIYEIAEAAGAKVLVIRMVVDRDVAIERSKMKFESKERKDHSPADVSIYDKLSAEDEPIENCTVPYLVLDTSKDDIDALIDKHSLLLE